MRAMVEVIAAPTRFLEQAAITTAMQKVNWKKVPLQGTRSTGLLSLY
jgi:hypothetical protein